MLGDYRKSKKDGDQKSKPHKPERTRTSPRNEDWTDAYRVNAAVRHFELRRRVTKPRRRKRSRNSSESPRLNRSSRHLRRSSELQAAVSQLLGMIEKVGERCR